MVVSCLVFDQRLELLSESLFVVMASAMGLLDAWCGPVGSSLCRGG